jgi:hypothetical protein
VLVLELVANSSGCRTVAAEEPHQVRYELVSVLGVEEVSGGIQPQPRAAKARGDDSCVSGRHHDVAAAAADQDGRADACEPVPGALVGLEQELRSRYVFGLSSLRREGFLRMPACDALVVYSIRFVNTVPFDLVPDPSMPDEHWRGTISYDATLRFARSCYRRRDGTRVCV